MRARIPGPLHVVLCGLAALGVGGCEYPASVSAAAGNTLSMAAANGASVAVLGRSLPDVLYSAVSGKDCSMVRLEQGKTYCEPNDPPPPARYCTRSLGTVDCWADRSLLPVPQTPVGDTPEPNLAQQRYRAARWPRSLTSQ